jgi:hypothetical protein
MVPLLAVEKTVVEFDYLRPSPSWYPGDTGSLPYFQQNTPLQLSDTGDSIPTVRNNSGRKSHFSIHKSKPWSDPVN